MRTAERPTTRGSPVAAVELAGSAPRASRAPAGRRWLPWLLLPLVGFAYSPVLRAGLLADDYAVLLGGRAEVGPLVRAWCALSTALSGLPAPGAAAWTLRLENLVVLGAAAFALRVFLRRLLEPWFGAGHAALAATSAAGLFLLHPLAPSAVAGMAARGELLGTALGLGSCALFLWSRQESRDPFTIVALAGLALAALASPVALGFAALCALAEYLAARRWRQRSLRARTALTTLALFGAGAVLPRVLLGVAPWAGAAGAGAGGAPGWEHGRPVEDLGRLILPVEPDVLGFAGVLLAGALLFLALQPSFRAARNAPRLWGGALATGCLALGLAELRTVAGDAPLELGNAWAALGAVAVLGAGLGLTSSALRGGRALFVQLALALGFAVLAHANARPWLRAGEEARAVQDELVRASAESAGAPLFYIDPPARVAGVSALGDSCGWLLHPRLTGQASEFDPGRVWALASTAFLFLTRLDELGPLRAAGACVLLPAEAPGGARASVRLAPAGAPASDLVSRGGALTQTFEPALDPLAIDAVRVSAELDVPARELERLGWRPHPGARTGLVRSVGGEQTSYFDLSSSLAWRLAGPVRTLVLEQGGVRQVERWEVLRRAPEFALSEPPRAEGSDWILSPAAGAPSGGECVLVLLALDRGEGAELALEAQAGRLRARGAERFAAAARARGAALAWSLDYRIGAHTVARVQGRLDPGP